MSVGAVVFDLDGTLIDSLGSLHRAASSTMEALGVAAPSREQVRGFIGDGVPMLVARCLAAAGAPPSEEAVQVFRAIYDADPLTGVEVLPGASQALAALAARGVALGLCTNKPEAPTRTLVEALRLGPFDAIVAGDTLGRRKPDPAPLLLVLERLGVAAAEAVYVGDSTVDARTAEAAGLRYLHVDGGYGAEGAPEGTTRLASLHEVPTILFPS